MAFIAPLLLGAAAGVAGTWAYLRRRPQNVVEKGDIVTESTLEESTLEGSALEETTPNDGAESQPTSAT